MSAAPKFGALVRGDDDNLHIRHFHTAASAAAIASAQRDLAMPPDARSAGIRSADLARELGVSSVTIRRAWKAGELPAKEHGERTLIIPHKIARLVRTFGLLGVRRMMRAGHATTAPFFGQAHQGNPDRSIG